MAFVIVEAQTLNGKTTRRGRNFSKLHFAQPNTPVCFVNRKGCFMIVIFSGDILCFHSSLSKTKAHFYSHKERELERERDGLLLNQRPELPPLTLALPHFAACAVPTAASGGSFRPSLRTVNVNDGLIWSFFIFRFHRIVSASVPTHKAQEGARTPILSWPPARWRW